MTAVEMETEPRVWPANDWAPTGAYCLSLAATKSGRSYVTRSDLMVWDASEIVAMNRRRVSGWLDGRAATLEFAAAYTATHPGCLTGDKAREKCLELDELLRVCCGSR